MDIRPMDIDDDKDIDDWLALRLAVHAADEPDAPAPTWHRLVPSLRRPLPGNEDAHLLATVDGRVAAWGRLRLTTHENRDQAWADLSVHPEFRRRGIGRALWERMLGMARSGGRTRVNATVVEGVDGGIARPVHGPEFLKTMGFTTALVEMRRRVDFSTVDDDAMRALLAGSWRRAEGYETVRWVNHAPPSVIDGAAYLEGRLLEDAPTGDLGWEPWKLDAERIRKNEAAMDATRRTRVNMVVRHRETGAVAALSWIMIPLGQREHAYQGATIVDPEHRGRRLGTVVKLELHDYARAVEPRLRYVQTTNADVNSFMIDINEAIGYRLLDARVHYQRAA